MSTFGGLDAEPYISLETFKKSGDGVKTPVWFARVGDALWVVTDGTSYKVKRLRRDPRVRLAQCDMRGAAILGAWHDGEGEVLAPADAPEALAALRKKYGLQFKLLDLGSKLGRRYQRRAMLKLTQPG